MFVNFLQFFLTIRKHGTLASNIAQANLPGFLYRSAPKTDSTEATQLIHMFYTIFRVEHNIQGCCQMKYRNIFYELSPCLTVRLGLWVV